MQFIVGIVNVLGTIIWQVTAGGPGGVTLNFPCSGKLRGRDALARVESALAASGAGWLVRNQAGWRIDLDQFRHAFPGVLDHQASWLNGCVDVAAEVDDEAEPFAPHSLRTCVRFVMTRESVEAARPTRIFLSHKGSDKARVRAIGEVLAFAGFSPWLDDDAMPAGANLERAIRQGFCDSCAAVFFVTPAFSDEKYLAAEVDYAIAEKRSKGDRFAIISLVFTGESQPPPATVPTLLRSYVWKEVGSDLGAIKEILRALPLVAVPAWRAR